VTERALILTVRVPGEAGEAVFHLAGEERIIGRDPSCDIVVEAPSVSGRHGALRLTAAGYAYADLGSRNGSVLLRAGGAELTPLAVEEPVLVRPGDALLLGDAGRPVRLGLREGATAYAAPAALPTRTVVAAAPLADLLGRREQALETLAARSLAATSARELADAALELLERAAPAASGRGVVIWGAGLHEEVGDPVPRGVRAAGAERGEVVLFEEASDPLPMTESLARAGVRAALVAPLRAGGGAYGVMAAWSHLGSAALPRAALPQLAVAASLVGLAAAQLAVRAEGELARRRLEAENQHLRGAGEGGLRVIEPIGESPAFLEVLRLARRVASADVPVLVLGETGTGKEVLARNLHRWSRRADRPFVAFNCAAVPETLIESELFGHVRGAFTGAGADRRGLFEEADGGTILLDEIGEMPLAMQAKLLRVLQDGEVRRVGASRTARVDVRVLSATHRDLATLVQEGRFRSDLMYRLNAVTLQLPALRERGDDVTLLAHFLLGRACDQARRRVPAFAADALWAMSRYAFPGNVRELENEVLRAVALTPEGECIRASALSERVAGGAPPPPAALASAGPVALKDAVAATERAVIEEALGRTGGNVSQAARELGLTRPGLYKVMERLGLRD